MDTYQSALAYFKALSQIPRLPLHEEKAKEWIVKWAEEKWWKHQSDIIGNLLVIAPGNTKEILCLQAHMDMVCVSEWDHNFTTQGVTVIEKEGKITANKTSLGADNGIGIAAMMALADLGNRPTLELIFTIGEEIWLVGAHNISLPLHAPIALNLDWCDSEAIGIGCGWTLLMQGARNLVTIPYGPTAGNENIFTLELTGMQWGHSGQDIRYHRGNALIEIIKVFKELISITHISNISGGEADNVIPHSAKAVIHYTGHPNLLQNELSHLQKILRTKYKCENIALTVIKNEKTTSLYRREDILPILNEILEIGTGVQTWWGQNTPLSSWNLGIFSLKNTLLSTDYFLRTNLPGNIEIMQAEITARLSETTWTLSHQSPVWLVDDNSPLIKRLQEAFRNKDNEPLPAITIHAAVEAGVLAEKFPHTQWVSVGATVHHMHTTKEYIKTKDFERFIERMEKFLQQ